MNYWLISDTHFNHTRLEDWGSRSGDWQEQLWRSLSQVPGEDTLIHLGDVCMGGEDTVHRRLTALPAGRKVLILGNHDTRSNEWYTQRGWDFVCDGFTLEYRGYPLWFSHRPQPRMGHFMHNIHGHTHGNRHRAEEYEAFYEPHYHVDISPELAGYRPLRLDTLIKSLHRR